MKSFRNLILLFSFLAFCYACSDSDDNSTRLDNSNIIEKNVIRTVTAEQIKEYYKEYLTQMKSVITYLNIEDELAKVKYDVEYTAVEYLSTDPFGNSRVVSGLVGYPVLPQEERNKSLKIASLQHGTLTYPDQAPSKETFTDINLVRDILMLVVPSLEKGYILSMPDYFGYGSDQNNLHYYEHRATLASTTRKLIELIPSYAKNKTLNANLDSLFLLGYSEGGFATISTLKSFSDTPYPFTDFITVAGSGAYDKVNTATEVLQKTTGDDPKFIASYAWVLLSYNNIYRLNRPLDQLFQSDVIPTIEKYTDNNSIMTMTNVPTQPNNVFSKTLVQNIANRSDKELVNVLSDNNVSDFDAKGSVSLIYGLSDTWIPPANTDSIYLNFIKRGVDVTKTTVVNGTHATTYAFFALRALAKLK